MSAVTSGVAEAVRARTGVTAKVGDTQIGGAEVIAPLRYAVSLVDHYQADLHLMKLLDKRLALQFLRRQIEDLQLPKPAAVERQPLFGARETRMDGSGRDVACAEIVNLIFHQRDQGRDHERNPRKHQRRNLKRDRFSTTRRQQAESVVAVKHRPDDLGL